MAVRRLEERLTSMLVVSLVRPVQVVIAALLLCVVVQGPSSVLVYDACAEQELFEAFGDYASPKKSPPPEELDANVPTAQGRSIEEVRHLLTQLGKEDSVDSSNQENDTSGQVDGNSQDEQAAPVSSGESNTFQDNAPTFANDAPGIASPRPNPRPRPTPRPTNQAVNGSSSSGSSNNLLDSIANGSNVPGVSGLPGGLSGGVPEGLPSGLPGGNFGSDLAHLDGMLDGAPTQILNQLTGGLIGNFLGGSGGGIGNLFGAIGGIGGGGLGGIGGGGGGFGGGGGGGNFPSGDLPGTPGGLYGNLTDLSKLYPGDRNREAEGEECEDNASADAADGPLSAGDTQVMSFVGDPGEMNAGIGETTRHKLGSSTPSKTYGPGSVDQMLSDLEAAAGDTSGKKYVVLMACHGSPGTPQNPGDWAGGSPGGGWSRGVRTVEFENALIRGADAAGNKDLSHITLVDGACFPCRGPWMATEQQGRGMTPINHLRHKQNQTAMQNYDGYTRVPVTVSNLWYAIDQAGIQPPVGGGPGGCGPVG